MTFTEKLSEIFGGLDKIAHFGFGAMITAIISIIAMLQDFGSLSVFQMASMSFVGFIPTLILAFMKEVIIDDTPDWKDFLFGLYGGLTIVIASYIGALLNILSN